MATKKITATRANVVPISARKDAVSGWRDEVIEAVSFIAAGIADFARLVDEPQRREFVARAIAAELPRFSDMATALRPMMHRHVAHHLTHGTGWGRRA